MVAPVTARELGALERGHWPMGDHQLAPAWMRVFLTRDREGRIVALSCYAAAVQTDPGSRVGRDVATMTVEDTYAPDATLAQVIDCEADPIDTAIAYGWAVDYWPESTLTKQGQPRMRAMDATARAYLSSLPLAWIESMPDPETGESQNA
jgi:hypothetical protein